MMLEFNFGKNKQFLSCQKQLTPAALLRHSLCVCVCVCVCMCVCACVIFLFGEEVTLTNREMSLCERVGVCVWRYVCVREWVCVAVCVCVRERGVDWSVCVFAHVVCVCGCGWVGLHV